MSVSYNGVPLNYDAPVHFPDIPAQQAQFPAVVTYMTAFHTTARDFDPSWQKTVQTADVVLHEELGWTNQNRYDLNAIARSGLRLARTFAPDRETYVRRRLESIAGTGIQQEFWDATADEVDTMGLRPLLGSYHANHAMAEELLGQGETDIALQTMASAHRALSEYDARRDAVGIAKVVEAINTLPERITQEQRAAKVAVFAGAAHIFQAVALDQRFAPALDVRANSLIENPFNLATVHYQNYLAGRLASPGDTARSWLFSLLREEGHLKAPYHSAARVANTVESNIAGITEDEVIGRLLSTAQAKKR